MPVHALPALFRGKYKAALTTAGLRAHVPPQVWRTGSRPWDRTGVAGVKRIFSEHAWEDYVYWQRTDRKILQRINTLIRESQRAPFEGIGKPEPLKHGMSGYWSRRITDEHRMVYKVEADALCIAQLRYH